jgi:hypothetical protein
MIRRPTTHPITMMGRMAMRMGMPMIIAALERPGSRLRTL